MKALSKILLILAVIALIFSMAACQDNGGSDTSSAVPGSSSSADVSSETSGSSSETGSSSSASSEAVSSVPSSSDPSPVVSDPTSSDSSVPSTGEVFTKLNDFGQRLIEVLRNKDYSYMNQTFSGYYKVDFTGVRLTYIAYEVKGKYVDVTYTVGNPGETGWEAGGLVTFRHQFTGNSTQGYTLSGAERIYEHVIIEE